MSDMVSDPKIRRLIKKYGADGYAVYNLILERVTAGLETESPLPDLEETAEDIADFLKMDTLRVEEIVWTSLEMGLFEQDEITGRVVVSKIYKFIQQSETRSDQIRQLIKAYKGSETPILPASQVSETNVKNRTEQNRQEENTTEESKSTRANTKHEKTGAPINKTRYENLCDEYGSSTVDDYIQRAVDYVDAKGIKPYADYTAAASNWLKRDGVKSRSDLRSQIGRW